MNSQRNIRKLRSRLIEVSNILSRNGIDLKLGENPITDTTSEVYWIFVEYKIILKQLEELGEII